MSELLHDFDVLISCEESVVTGSTAECQLHEAERQQSSKLYNFYRSLGISYRRVR